jgi:hypothetical protein
MRALVLSAVSFFLLLSCPVDLVASLAADSHLLYRCDHLLLGTLGELQLETRYQDDGKIVVRLSGDALGLAALLDGHRHHDYETVLARQPDGQLQTLSHQRITHIDSRGRRIQYGWRLTFSQESRVLAERLWGGEVVETRHHRAQTPCYGDFLSVLIAFQDCSDALRVGERMDYTFFTMDGPAKIRVDVVDREMVSIAGEAKPVWRCNIASPSGRLPGGYRSMVLWCNETRQVVKGRGAMMWGFGSLNVRQAGEAL